MSMNPLFIFFPGHIKIETHQISSHAVIYILCIFQSHCILFSDVCSICFAVMPSYLVSVMGTSAQQVSCVQSNPVGHLLYTRGISSLVQATQMIFTHDESSRTETLMARKNDKHVWHLWFGVGISSSVKTLLWSEAASGKADTDTHP